jgi:hypothetical protein
MNKLTLKNFKSIKNNMFVGIMTIEEYSYLVKEGFIEVSNKITDITHAENMADNYNKSERLDKNLNELPIFTVSLVVEDNDINKLTVFGDNLLIESDSIKILDGENTTLIMSYLDEKFYGNKISVIIYYYTDIESKNLLMTFNKQNIKENNQK